LFFIPIPQPIRQDDPAEGGAQKKSYRQDLREGFQYVLKWPGLLGLILLATMLNFLLSPSSALLPLLVTDVFNGDVAELGWVQSVFGIGVILGGLILGAWGGFKRRIITSFCGVAGIGLGTILTGIIPGTMFSLLLVVTFLIGFAQVFANSPLQAIFQSTITPEMQGRVFSLISAGATAMMPLSLLIAGPVADWQGVQFWYLVGGVICVLMVIASTFIPAIMQIEENQNMEMEESLPE
jgi:DHA3 family macrolide efflux protein-like MFS transporter